MVRPPIGTDSLVDRPDVGLSREDNDSRAYHQKIDTAKLVEGKDPHPNLRIRAMYQEIWDFYHEAPADWTLAMMDRKFGCKVSRVITRLRRKGWKR